MSVHSTKSMQRSPSGHSVPFTTTPRGSPPPSQQQQQQQQQQPRHHQQQQQHQYPTQHHQQPTNDSRETHIYTLDYAESHQQGSERARTPPLRQQSPTMAFSNIPLQQPSKWKHFRLRVMRMATVERLRILWGLLALVSTAAWLALMPAYAFRNKISETGYSNPSYTFFLVATVFTSTSAIWQSLCPFLVRRSQRSLLPRIINHPWTQTATIIISVILTILNFLSWIVLAANADGAKTDCHTGKLAKLDGYVMQCQAINTAIALNAIVFLLWIPIAVVIVCGTVERGLWWWGEDDGAFADSSIPRGSKMMSEEEFDFKIGLREGGGSASKLRSQGGENGLSSDHLVYDEVQVPKPAFVTPIAAQFKSPGDPEIGSRGSRGEDDYSFTPSSYRRHHQQRQQQHRQQQQQMQQQPRSLERRTSNQSLAPSLSSRLSTFFGAGWNSGPMPPPPATPEPPVPKVPKQYQRPKEPEPEPEPENSQDLPADGFATQWHSRRDTDWD